MELPPEGAAQIPSGEYQGLPDPPAKATEKQGPVEQPRVDERAAIRWALGYIAPHLFAQNPADQGRHAGNTMYPEVN